MYERTYQVGILFIVTLLIFGCGSPASTTKPNAIPVMVELLGQTTVKVGQTYEFTSLGFDPDGDKVSYHFGTWLEGEYETNYHDLGWTDFYNSNTEGKKGVSWKRVGQHNLCSYCRDTNGGESDLHVVIQIIVVEE